jgi:hypothetical protein
MGLVGSSIKEGLKTSCFSVEAISEFMKRKQIHKIIMTIIANGGNVSQMRVK